MLTFSDDLIRLGLRDALDGDEKLLGREGDTLDRTGTQPIRGRKTRPGELRYSLPPLFLASTRPEATLTTAQRPEASSHPQQRFQTPDQHQEKSAGTCKHVGTGRQTRRSHRVDGQRAWRSAAVQSAQRLPPPQLPGLETLETYGGDKREEEGKG